MVKLNDEIGTSLEPLRSIPTNDQLKHREFKRNIKHHLKIAR